MNTGTEQSGKSTETFTSIAIGAIIGFIGALMLQPTPTVDADEVQQYGTGAAPDDVKEGIYKVGSISIWSHDGQPTMTWTIDSINGSNGYVIAGPSGFKYTGAAILPDKLVGITNGTVFCFPGDPQEIAFNASGF